MKDERIDSLDVATPADLQAVREAMIAQSPSPENPFKTRKPRLRRVNYILREALKIASTTI